MAAFLQTPSGDLALTRGRLTLVTGKQEKAQKIANRLKLFLGEWFLDTRIGTPWYQVVTQKQPDLELARRMFQRVILSVEGIVEVQDVSFTWDRAGRALSYEWIAIDDEGQQISGASQDPFVVETS